ncbi:MAG: hypothetical protein HQ567_07695 [Candidatus Nealsonbacteria bacterium]|nr:hypothetical protein [Candidatus Nealsonbacteria bacterium]
MLDPFSRDIFDRLDPLLRKMYLADVVPRIITNPDGNGEVLAAFDELTDGPTSPDNDFLAAWQARGNWTSAGAAVLAAAFQTGIGRRAHRGAVDCQFGDKGP